MRNKLQKLFIVLVLIVVSAATYIVVSPQNPDFAFSSQAAAPDLNPFNNYDRARVVAESPFTVRLETGPLKETEITADPGQASYEMNDRVVVSAIEVGDEQSYVVVDRYRLPGVLAVIGVFIALALLFARWRGFTSLVGLGVAGLVLIYFIAPQIIAGKNPFLVSFIGALIIALVGMFVAHGFSKRTQLSALSTITALVLTAGVSWSFVWLAHLLGLGESDAYLLSTGFMGTIDLRGILLGGIMIAVLGVLDDITTSQTAAVEQLHNTDQTLPWQELYRRGIDIGREHIVSLINTLLLVYAGASLPLFLLLTITKHQPIWVMLNSEYVAEELVRSLVGSIALIIAVPIATLIAARYFGNKHS